MKRPFRGQHLSLLLGSFGALAASSQIACSVDAGAGELDVSGSTLSDSASGSETSASSSESSGAEAGTGDGDGDAEAEAEASSGDGDGDDTSGDGDGDGDATSGDGDGDATSGDGDGDGDASSGDGDGDGDATSGDGDGDGDGDTTTGDGDGDTCLVGACTIGAQQCSALNEVQDCVDDGLGCGTWVINEDCDARVGAFSCVEETGDASCVGDQSCLEESPMVDFEPATVMFVLDFSGSMCDKVGTGGGPNCNPNGDTRWRSLRTVMNSTASQYENTLKFGAKIFPSDDACDVDAAVEVEPAIGNAAILSSDLPCDNCVDEFGGTPAESGYRQASDWMDDNLPPVSQEKQAIIFILDGGISDGRSSLQGAQCSFALECAPACDNLENACGSLDVCDQGWADAPTDNEVASLTQAIDQNEQQGIPTFVVGIDIDAGLTGEMNGYADAGGFPQSGSVRYYDTASQAALNAALQSIVSVVATCDIDLSVVAPFPDTTQVSVDGVIYPPITEAECDMGTQGWFYSDAPTNLQIRLCGTACDNFQTSGDANVEYFCTAG